MSRNELIDRALSLPKKDRANLAARLLESLDEGVATSAVEQAAIDKAWANEAERRLKLYREGKLKAAPFDIAMKKIRAKLKK